MDDMHDQHESPTSDAARGVGQYMTSALAATELAVRVRTWATKRGLPGASDALEPGDLDQAGQVLDPKREAYGAMLRPDRGRDTDSRTAMLAWITAQPDRADDPEADLVAGRAEERLRDLHPDALTRYDQLRADLSPVEAMREVVPLLATEQAASAEGPSAATAETDAAAAVGEAPLRDAMRRYTPVVREVLEVELAERVLRDDAWPDLARSLATAERLGAKPAHLLRDVATERELGSARNVAEVLSYRVEQRQPSAPDRSATAADLAATSYPSPLATADRASSPQLPDLALLGTAMELGREADTERQTARSSAGTEDDASTPNVDEHRDGQVDAGVHVGHAGADQARAREILSAKATSRDEAPPTSAAGRSYPTPVGGVPAAAAVASPVTNGASSRARPAVSQQATGGRPTRR